MSVRDEGRHAAAGAGAPADPGLPAGSPDAGAEEVPAEVATVATAVEEDEDMLQAVVDFIDDLVESDDAAAQGGAIG